MQAAFVREDMNEISGCTVVVPGNHQSGRYSDRSLKNEFRLKRKQEILLFGIADFGTEPLTI